MNGIGLEITLILLLILCNGFFAGSEIAIIAARRGRLQQQSEQGSRGARLALSLASDPNRFLPTVQVGINAISTLAAVISGAAITDRIRSSIEGTEYGPMVTYAPQLAMVITVGALTFITVVIGELAPKRLALLHADRWATIAAVPMHWLSMAVRPAVWLMGKSSEMVLWLFRAHRVREPSVSVDDIQHLIETGQREGILDPVEKRLALGALRMGERTVKQIMRPRGDIDALEVTTPPGELMGTLAMAGYSRIPVYEKDLDHIIGFVHLKDVLRQHYFGWPLDLKRLLHPPVFVPESMPIDRLLQVLQSNRCQLAIVLDEFGGTEGMVTMEDVLAGFVRELSSDGESDSSQDIVRREDGSLLIDGNVILPHVLEILELEVPEEDLPKGVKTLAGVVMDVLGRLPRVGDVIDWNGFRMEIIDMDGRRIDRLLIQKRTLPADPEGA